jgi:hypothetical protein
MALRAAVSAREPSEPVTGGVGGSAAERRPAVPVGVIMEIKAPPDAFLAVCEALGINDRGPGTPGCLFEWAHTTEYGFRVLSLFDTEANAHANVQIAEAPEACGGVNELLTRAGLST